MEPVIQRLSLKGYHSFSSEQVSFDNPTFLVGQNGAGKSKLVDALAFLSEAMSFPLTTVIARRGGIANLTHKTPGADFMPGMGLAVDFGGVSDKIDTGHYAFEIRFLADHGFEIVDEQCVAGTGQGLSYFKRRDGGGGCETNISGLRPLLDPRSLGLLSISGSAQFAPIAQILSSIRVYSIQPDRLREPQAADSGTPISSRARTNRPVVSHHLAAQGSGPPHSAGQPARPRVYAGMG